MPVVVGPSLVMILWLCPTRKLNKDDDEDGRAGDEWTTTTRTRTTTTKRRKSPTNATINRSSKNSTATGAGVVSTNTLMIPPFS